MTRENCGCPCSCGHAHDPNLPVLCVFCRAMATYQMAESGESPIDLKEMAEVIRETNRKNGFTRPSWDNLPIKVMMAVTELNEAMDAIKGEGEDPLIEELADTAIRVLDILESVWQHDWADRTVALLQTRLERNLFEPGEVALWRPLRMLCTAVESWRYENQGDTRISLEIALREVFTLALSLGVDLGTVIQWKNEKNATRGIRHGKARAEG